MTAVDMPPEVPLTESARRVAIVGLGPTGVALGRALARVRTNFRLVGHDRDHDRLRAAVQLGAVDKGEWNLPATVEGADLVVLAEPLGQLLATMATIAPYLGPGCLVTDTAPVKVPVLGAAERLLPPGVSFIGGHPVLRRVAADPGAPLAGCTYCLVPLPTAAASAVRAMTDLVGAMGAEPLFIDGAEHDALAAAVVQLPEVVSVVLARLVEDSPSARDLWRLAGPAFGEFTYLPDGTVADRREALLANAQAVQVWLDQAVDGLQAARRAVAEADADALTALLSAAETARRHLERPPGDDLLADPYEDVRDLNPARRLFRFGRRRRAPR